VRFFLDNDVDDAVARMLRRARHQTWTAADAGLARAPDDALSVYADDRGAALVTHDREFTARRRRHPIGQHIRLACKEWEAAALLRDRLPYLLPILEARTVVTVVLSKGRAPLVLEDDWRDGGS
jgi:predicted nuclease of predicted toxin-antitoxin system